MDKVHSQCRALPVDEFRSLVLVAELANSLERFRSPPAPSPQGEGTCGSLSSYVNGGSRSWVGERG